MILQDSEIKKRLDNGDLVIHPIEDRDVQIQPASVDLRLGAELILHEATNISHIDPTKEISLEDLGTKKTLDQDEKFILHPGDFVLATTKERVEIPADLLGTVEGRSSIGRVAVTIHSTAGVIDPGFKGEITLELSNEGRVPVALRQGMRIGQIIIKELKGPAERPYGEERGSKYQEQSGPQHSKIDEDVDI